ncbi:anti-sigma-F factor Fin [Paenactinomyces guangxiensis]|uniref:DUF2757 family protein n=1 Tax=Paenactinomyces guangxiensis TaxID=1490290 RepID=A0A7W1WTJ4_9BACL|nr:anti-sigma-F factor Fin [Paenactinomyces guangxiensis]MBA4495818.1 DUF2757 family protein [Paenactinomyces guangxiensis]MBH8592908.1 DUF2757 family protein [Paenactinomyces guangxiensis]
MAINYICRYCNTLLGKLDATDLTDSQLGFDRLTPDEREDIITSDIGGNRQVRVICESCQKMIEGNPERSISPYLFH